jgi:hypothetical protein
MKFNWRALIPTKYIFDIVKFSNGTYGVRRRLIRFAKKNILLVSFLDAGEQNYWWSLAYAKDYCRYNNLHRARDDLALCQKHGNHPNIIRKELRERAKQRAKQKYETMTTEDFIQDLLARDFDE